MRDCDHGGAMIVIVLLVVAVADMDAILGASVVAENNASKNMNNKINSNANGNGAGRNVRAYFEFQL